MGCAFCMFGFMLSISKRIDVLPNDGLVWFQNNVGFS
jgi:hypothetical protein